MSDSISREVVISAVKRLSLGETDAMRLAMRIGDYLKRVPSAQPEWIPCSERMPEEDHWLGGSGRQFSDEVLVSVVNCDDEDIWTYISQTIDGEWALELPSHCNVIAWMPLPEPYKGDE